MDLISRFRRSSAQLLNKKAASIQPKKIPTKYFVGQLDKPKRGLPFRIFRQRKTMLGAVMDEVCLKTGYDKVGIFVHSQAAVRADRKMFEAAHLVKQKKRQFILAR